MLIMATIKNSWIEKIKRKKEHETAPSYERDPLSDTYAYDAKKPKKRFSVPATAILVKTLRGVRR